MKSKTNNKQTISNITDEQNSFKVKNCCKELNLNSKQLEAVMNDLTLFYNVDNLKECILCFLTGRNLL